ncbi:MAG: UPF0175 family protein [Verrucomicrobia bacterium]|nr:UPF0175 family protein [Verrucomicrobiota bacterium]
MKAMTIEVPDEVQEADVKRAVAIRLFEEGTVSLGRAAQIAGQPKLLFMEELARLRIPVINLSPEERARELSDD